MTRRRRTVLGAAATTAAIALLATGCASGGNNKAAPATDTIRATIEVPSSFDPTITLSRPDFIVARMAYDTLLRKDDTGLVGGLATKWSSTPTQAVLTIREGATCADGTKITPSVVKGSLDFFARAESGSAMPATVFGPGNVATVTADESAGTVTIDLQNPWPDLLQGLSVSSTGIVCPKGIADPAGLAAGKVKGSESGPYELASFH